MSQGNTTPMALDLGDGWFKSNRSNFQGQSVTVKLGAKGILVGDDKPGRDGQYGDVSFEAWDAGHEAALKGRYDDMPYDQVGVEWFGDFATMPDDAPRYDAKEIAHFLDAVKDGQLSVKALTERTTDADQPVPATA